MTGIVTKQTTWKADPMHSSAEFSAKHMMISTVRGKFNSVNATIYLDESDFTRSHVEAAIDAKSINTGVEYRDNHLRSADFLDVENYPEITFVSKRIERKGDDEYRVTVHGQTREVALDAEYDGRGKDQQGGERISFTGKTSINRKDWGLNWNVALETGGVLVGETIKIEVFVEAVKQDEAQA
jgi:polyisoprenoid-binding protein YceI